MCMHAHAKCCMYFAWWLDRQILAKVSTEVQYTMLNFLKLFYWPSLFAHRRSATREEGGGWRIASTLERSWGDWNFFLWKRALRSRELLRGPSSPVPPDVADAGTGAAAGLRYKCWCSQRRYCKYTKALETSYTFIVSMAILMHEKCSLLCANYIILRVYSIWTLFLIVGILLQLIVLTMESAE